MGHFRSCPTAMNRLSQFQHQMGRTQHKLIQEAKWKSTFTMFQRLYEQREPLGAVLSTLKSELSPFTADEYDSMNQCLRILGPLHQATVEMSEEKRVSASKVIPMISMLKISIRQMCTQMTSDTGSQLAANLLKQMNERLATHEQTSCLALATFLDPRFKTVVFSIRIRIRKSFIAKCVYTHTMNLSWC